MSNWACPVINIGKIEKHPNADALSVTEVNGEALVIRTEDWKEGDLAVYIPVDSVVPLDHPAFSFLSKEQPPKPGSKMRIKAKKLRGLYSEGLLVSPGFASTTAEGADVSASLGVEKYDDSAPLPGIVKAGNNAEDPGVVPVYDMESLKKYRQIFIEGEEVVATEKLHGTNSRFVYLTADDKLHVGSRQRFTKDCEDDLWWRVVRKYNLGDVLRQIPNIALFGEIVGAGVQKLTYNHKPGEFSFFAFDMFDTVADKWLSYDEFLDLCSPAKLGIPTVPELYRGPYSEAAVLNVVEPRHDEPALKSTIADHIREGAVIKPVVERRNRWTGRTQLKLVSHAYKLGNF